MKLDPYEQDALDQAREAINRAALTKPGEAPVIHMQPHTLARLVAIIDRAAGR